MAGVVLAQFEEAHLAPMAEVIHDPEIRRFTRFPEPPDPAVLPSWLERYRRGRRTGTSELFAAVDPADGAFLGAGMAPEIDPLSRELELGYLVAPWARGRGVATEILRRLTLWAFGPAGALRAVLLIDVENAASLRVAERCGYVREGVLRSVHVKGGVRADTAVWSRLPSDPPPPDG